jgi:metallo-beta-lactamase family protein
MTITFHGAARTVTGSKHLVTLEDGTKILLDCGLFQGLGDATDDLNENFGFDPNEISFLLLSHAHIDHSGLIPKLAKDGFRGKIYCTPATRDLAEILLFDSAEIQTYEAEFINKKRLAKGLKPYEPLYTTEDVTQAMQLFETIEYNEWLQLTNVCKALFTNAGHLIGAAAISIHAEERTKQVKLLYSGDVGRYRSVLLQPPSEVLEADYIILESTYGNKHHDLTFNTIEVLQKFIRQTCVQKEGKLVIPAFSVGRTQEVLYALNQLSLEKKLPEINYFVDSPLSTKATEVIKRYSDGFNERLQQVLKIDDDPFDFPGLKYVASVEDSKKLVDFDSPCVIISASGTADAGRVRHHINSCIEQSKNTILFVGYCGSQSLGGRLLAGEKEIEVFTELCPVEATIDQLQGMSAHADTNDLCKFLDSQNTENVREIFLVHGEYKVQQEFASRLERKGFDNITIPELHQCFTLSDKKKTPLKKAIKEDQ